jgi:CelD/BcsL family acetyltransferase involved in cellulose biosynthesis
VPLAVDWIDDRRDFDALADEWDGLLGADARPFDLHCWYATWWEAFAGGRELAVCTVRRDGKLAGVLPLLRDGRRLTALANSHSPVFRPLARDVEAGDDLLRAAMAEGASQLELISLPTEEPCVAALRENGAAPMIALLEAGEVSPIVETTGELEAWRKKSKSRWGAPLERLRRKMVRDHDAELSIVEAPADLEDELEDGFRVEASGWKGKAGTAIVSAPETETFYRNLARAFHRRDELRLSRIVLDGETAAFDFCLLHRGRLYLLKTGFDERYRRLAPGLVMRLSIVERCFEMGLEAHELLGDETEWKRKFATSARAHANVRAYSRNPAGLARYAYRASIRPLLKKAYRRVRPQHR